MVNIDDVFSIIALFILFRETVEASIVCGVLSQFLDRSKPKLKKAVWWGIFGGVITSIVFGIIFVVVFYVARNNLFKGKNKDLFKGIISWLAAILITWLGFKMFRFMGWEDKWKRKLEAAAAKRLAAAQAARAAAAAEAASVKAITESGEADASSSDAASDSATTASHLKTLDGPKDSAMTMVTEPTSTLKATVGAEQQPGAATHTLAKASISTAASGVDQMTDAELAEAMKAIEEGRTPLDMTEPTRREFWDIFSLVWVTVTREGIESVVFLGGVGGHVKASAIPLAGFVGITAGVLLGMFLFYTGRTVKDLKYFLIIMGVVVLFIAAGQVSIGTDAMIRAGMFGYCSIWMDERPWYMQPMWDISECCGDTDDQNKFFALMRAIFGYQDKPTMIEACFYCGYWVIIVIVIIIKWKTGTLFDADYKWKREQAKLAKQREQEAREAEMLAITAGPAADADAAEGVPVGADAIKGEGVGLAAETVQLQVDAAPAVAAADSRQQQQ